MKRTLLYSVLCMTLGLSVPGCGTSDNSQQPVGFTTVTLDHVTSNGLITWQPTVIRTDVEWTTFWDLLYQNYLPKPDVPTVNFAENVVIALVDRAATGVTSFTITGIQPVSSGVTVHASRVTAGQGCNVAQEVTQQFHIVTTPKFPGPASLDLSQSAINCGP